MTANMLDRVSLDVFYTPADHTGFRLDDPITGKLNADEARLAASTGEAWHPITDDVVNISIKRGSTPNKLATSPDIGTLTVTFVDRPSSDIRPSTPIRVTADGKRLFTGQVLDIRESDTRKKDASGPVTVVTVTAVDRVADIANTMRFGAYQTPAEDTPWATFETAAQRFERYLAPHGWSWNGPAHLHSGWDNIGIWNLGTSQGSVITIPATPERPSHVAYTLFEEPQGSGFSVSATFGGLPPATEVTVALWAWNSGTDALGSLTVEGVQLPADGSPVRITKTLTTTSGGLLSVSLVPSGFTPSMATAFSFTGLTITSGPNAPVEIQNIVYESNLANHLDLTANTTKGSWWVDATNVIQVRVGPEIPASSPPIFTDGTIPEAEEIIYDSPTLYDAPTFYDGGGVGDLSYIDLDLAFDTARAVNTLTFANHGRIFDDDTGSYVADDIVFLAGTEPTSIATYGARAETLDTAFPITAPALDGLTAALPDLVARAYLDEASTPTKSPRFMRIRNAPDLQTPDLDVRALLGVLRAGQVWTCTITGITHTITRHHWHTDYTLIPKQEN